MKEYRARGYIVKIIFVGDPSDSFFRFKLYKPRKRWFPVKLWTETIHRDHISHYKETCELVIRNYEEDANRWI